MKRFISIFLSLLLLCTALPLSAIAANGDPVYPAGTVVEDTILDEYALSSEEPANTQEVMPLAAGSTSSGLATYTVKQSGTTSSYTWTKKTGLYYNLHLKPDDFYYGTSPGFTYSKAKAVNFTFSNSNTKSIYFGFLLTSDSNVYGTAEGAVKALASPASLSSGGRTSSEFADAMDVPIIKVWIDDVLVEDGTKIKAAYAAIEAKDTSTSMYKHRFHNYGGSGSNTSGGQSSIDLMTAVSNVKRESDGNMSWDTDDAVSVKPSTMSLGKHTIRVFINAESYTEEYDSTDNDVTYTFYVKEPCSKTATAPVLSSVTSSSITVVGVAGQEYSIDNGTTWQDSNVFSNLNASVSYEIITRVKATETMMESETAGPLQVTTKPPAPDAPAAPTLASKTATSITVNVVSGLEYSIDGGRNWQTAGLFNNLQPNTRYEIIARVKAVGDTPCSEPSGALEVVTPKKTVAAPGTPVLVSRTDTTITIKASE